MKNYLKELLISSIQELGYDIANITYSKKKPIQTTMFDDDDEIQEMTSEISDIGSRLRRPQIARNPSIRKARERQNKELIGQSSFDRQGVENGE